MPTSREGRDAFRRLPAARVLDMMFRVQARELYPEVSVLGHPRSMRAFRDFVHAGWLVNTCATTRCHGGEKAADPILFNRKPTSSRSVYTNFLILERYTTSDGEYLINYQDPERSPLLQLTLPRSDSIYPHPDVPGWSPVFTTRDSRGFRRAVRWIELMYKPRPEHPVEYTPPTAGPGAMKAPEEPGVVR